MILKPHVIRYQSVKPVSFLLSLSDPNGIKQFMNMPARVLDLLCRDAAKRSCRVVCFMVATDRVSASVAFPERQRAKVLPVWIDLCAVRETGFDFLAASTAINHRNDHYFTMLNRIVTRRPIIAPMKKSSIIGRPPKPFALFRHNPS